MRPYLITFKWGDSDIYCTNICVAPDEDSARKRYESLGYQVVGVREADAYECNSAQNRGMPIVRVY